MKSVFTPLQEQLVDEKSITQVLLKLNPIPHTENQYLTALHDKTEIQASLFERRPDYQNTIFRHLAKEEFSNANCKKCNYSLSWGAGKTLCRFCGWWVCSSCVSKERPNPEDPEVNVKICQECEQIYLKSTINHEYYVRENILEAVFKRLVNEQFQLQKLTKEEIKRSNETQKKMETNNAMSKIIAINKQKVNNQSLKQEVQILKQKLDKAEKIYKQLVLKCHSKKKILLDNKASFASEISKVNLVDEDDETIEPPTAIENDTKTSRDDSRSQSFMTNILDEYNKVKLGPKQQQQEDIRNKSCKCILF